MEHVWIRDMEGQLVCVAERDANKSSYFQKPIVDAAKDKRAEKQIQRLRRKEDDLLANTRAGLEVYEPVKSAMPEVTPQVAARMARLNGDEPEAIEPPLADVFTIPSDVDSKLRLWRALQTRVDDGEVLNGREEKFHRGFAQSADYRAAIRMENLFGQEKGPANGAS
jgi:putative transposase